MRSDFCGFHDMIIRKKLKFKKHLLLPEQSFLNLKKNFLQFLVKIVMKPEVLTKVSEKVPSF